MDALKTIAASSLKAETPKFNIGDTIKVGVNIREGEKERVQMFEGTVIAKKSRWATASLRSIRPTPRPSSALPV